MKTFYIGVDPGVPITMVMLDHRGRWVAHASDKAVLEIKKVGKKEVRENSIDKIIDVLQKWVREAAKRGAIVELVLERVWAQPGEGVTSATKFIGSAWMMRTAAACLDMNCVQVTPQVWKKYFALTKSKARSLDLANKTFPKKSWRLKNLQDHNYAEAALIARYQWEHVRNRAATQGEQNV